MLSVDIPTTHNVSTLGSLWPPKLGWFSAFWLHKYTLSKSRICPNLYNPVSCPKMELA